MRSLVAVIVLAVIAVGLAVCVADIPFGRDIGYVSGRYVGQGTQETGAANIVTSVVVSYRGFDTLGEVTVLFIAAMGLGAVLYGRRPSGEGREKASLILTTGCRFLFPLIMVFGAYVFVHGHLTPGGGFQGGVIVASAFLLMYMGCAEKRLHKATLNAVESLAGLAFVIAGLAGLAVGGYFLMNVLPKGTLNTLFSAGIIPVIYIAIGLKVGSELAGIVGTMMEVSE
jgi:multicomponent Na+:H+ antiporter subunit B